MNEIFLEGFEPSDFDEDFLRSGLDKTDANGKLWLDALRELPGPSIKLGAKVTLDDFRLSEDPAKNRFLIKKPANPIKTIILYS